MEGGLDMANTLKLPNRVETEKMRDNNAEGRFVLPDDITVVGKNDRYEVFSDMYVDKGGEGVIYMARRLSDNGRVAAKIYDEPAVGSADEENREHTLTFLRAHSSDPNSNILPLLDNAVADIQVRENATRKFQIDFMPYCEEGAAKAADYKTLREFIIPQMLEAINLMHNSDLVHRDIKPDNILKYGDKYVLSDFGLTCKLIEVLQDEELVFYTVLGRGTQGYVAPEVAGRNQAYKASDYFSLGATIATLYNKGRHIYQSYIDGGQNYQLNYWMDNFRFPLNCPDHERDLQLLVDALTWSQPRDRVGYEEVQEWLKPNGPETFMKKYRDKGRSGKIVSYTFGKAEYTNIPMLIAAFASDWDNAKKHLYDDNIADTFRDHQEFRSLLKELVDNDNKREKTNLNLAKTLFYMNERLLSLPSPIYWKGKTFWQISEISAKIKEKKVTEEEISTLLSSGYLRWKLEQSGGEGAEGRLEIVNRLMQINQMHPKLVYYITMYELVEDKSANEFHGAKTPDELFQVISEARDHRVFYNSCLRDRIDYELLAFLYILGYRKDVIDIADKYESGDQKFFYRYEDIESLYVLFERICENKTAVREHYYYFGPHSHLYWLQQNLHLYKCHSLNAEKLLKSIKEVKISNEMVITDVLKAFLKLDGFEKNLFRMFQKNILLAKWGLKRGDGTWQNTSDSIDAFYLRRFCRSHVPLGHYKKMYPAAEASSYTFRGDIANVKSDMAKIISAAREEAEELLKKTIEDVKELKENNKEYDEKTKRHRRAMRVLCILALPLLFGSPFLSKYLLTRFGVEPPLWQTSLGAISFYSIGVYMLLRLHRIQLRLGYIEEINVSLGEVDRIVESLRDKDKYLKDVAIDEDLAKAETAAASAESPGERIATAVANKPDVENDAVEKYFAEVENDIAKNRSVSLVRDIGAEISGHLKTADSHAQPGGKNLGIANACSYITSLSFLCITLLTAVNMYRVENAVMLIRDALYRCGNFYKNGWNILWLGTIFHGLEGRLEGSHAFFAAASVLITLAAIVPFQFFEREELKNFEPPKFIISLSILTIAALISVFLLPIIGVILTYVLAAIPAYIVVGIVVVAIKKW